MRLRSAAAAVRLRSIRELRLQLRCGCDRLQPRAAAIDSRTQAAAAVRLRSIRSCGAVCDRFANSGCSCGAWLRSAAAAVRLRSIRELRRQLRCGCDRLQLRCGCDRSANSGGSCGAAAIVACSCGAAAIDPRTPGCSRGAAAIDSRTQAAAAVRLRYGCSCGAAAVGCDRSANSVRQLRCGCDRSANSGCSCGAAAVGCDVRAAALGCDRSRTRAGGCGAAAIDPRTQAAAAVRLRSIRELGQRLAAAQVRLDRSANSGSIHPQAQPSSTVLVSSTDTGAVASGTKTCPSITTPRWTPFPTA